jgi:uncharacterized membrane protein YkvA (DUF1232 family)
MSMRITFELSDKDVFHFHECMEKARNAVKDAEEHEIIDAARGLFVEMQDARAPTFVKDRLHQLESMLAMLEDENWNLPEAPRNRLLRALVYFCDPDDLIPDNIPGIGYLDDAIMIELVFRELKHEIEAFDDFQAFCKTYNRRFKLGRDSASRAKRIKVKRDDLMERIERRKLKDSESHPEASGLF